MERNKLKKAIRAKTLALGMFVNAGSPALVEWMAYAGIDFVTIEMVHTAFGLETVQNLVRTAKAHGITPLVRVPEINPSLILRVLDIGAEGITIPGLRSKQEAIQAVRAIKYPPEGERGAHIPPAVRASGEKASDYTRRANEETIVNLVCETRESVNNIEEILSVAGIDLINIGPGDLSLSLGLPGQYDHPQVVGAVEKVMTKCLERGVAVKVPGQTYGDPLFLKKWYDKGVRVIELGGEDRFFHTALKNAVEDIRATLKPTN
jgi:2-keto-3-deoxy-L-rhamnonate aldolase RhmA